VSEINRSIRKRNTKLGLNNLKTALPFILPGFILVSIFVLYPMIFTIRISFSEYQIVNREITWKGLDNFIAIFSDQNNKFWYALRNNFLYAIITVPCIIFLGMLFAFLINNLKKGKTLFKVGFYLPVITSWVIVGLVFQYMFNSSNRGLINYILVDVLHLTENYIPWLLREWTGNFAIWIMGIWKNTGWAMLIYMAALQGISKELYEAASLDGASSWQKFRKIVIPLLKPTTFYVLVNMIIGSFNVFIQVMLLTSGNPNGKTSVLQYLLYDRAFNQFEFGEASAIGMITSITILLVTILLNKGFKLDGADKEDVA
jgi:multiple sugar transport system permease protein